MAEPNMKNEYSERFDQLRKNRVEVSFHKYGPAKTNFKDKLVDATKKQKTPSIWLMQQII